MNERVNKDHNASPVENPELQKLWSQFKKLDEDAKAIARTKRELKVEAKTKHGFESAVFDEEYRKQKLEPDVRASREASQKDLQAALGYDLSKLIVNDYDPNQDPLEAARKQKARDKQAA